jgi:hypothetical protein
MPVKILAVSLLKWLQHSGFHLNPQIGFCLRAGYWLKTAVIALWNEKGGGPISVPTNLMIPVHSPSGFKKALI